MRIEDDVGRTTPRHYAYISMRFRNSHADGRPDAQFGFVISMTLLRCSGCGSNNAKRWKVGMYLNTEERNQASTQRMDDTIVTRDLSAAGSCARRVRWKG